MISITRKHMQAINVYLCIAAFQDTDKPVSADTVADVEGISRDYVNQLALEMRKAGLVESVRGPKGGFITNGLPEEVTIGDIVASVPQSEAYVTAFPDNMPKAAQDAAKKAVADYFHALGQCAVSDVLNTYKRKVQKALRQQKKEV